MPSGTFVTPRPVPSLRLQTIGGTVVVLLALPVFVVGGWPLEAWGIAAVLWAVNVGIGLVLQRLSLGMDSLVSAGVVAFGRMFRAAGLVTVLIVIAVKNPTIGLPAAVVYGLAFTAEFVLSFVAYFVGGETEA